MGAARSYKRNAFQRELVKLRRVARHIVDLGEDHGPGNVGRTSPQFAVDEVAETPSGTSGAMKSVRASQGLPPPTGRGWFHQRLYEVMHL